MEKVSLASSGSYVTDSELCAVVPRLRSTDDGLTARFFFRLTPFGPRTEIEWPSDSDIALLPCAIAETLRSHGWARNLMADEADAYNAAVETFILGMTGAPPVSGGAPPPVSGEAPPPVSGETPPPISNPFVPPAAAATSVKGAPDKASWTKPRR